MSRYARQMILPEVGVSGQSRLGAARVLVVGAGGLGCPVLQYLTGAGIGQITIMDPDHIEESNLHRQPLYRMADLGRSKAETAQRHLMASNPDVQITARIEALHPGNVGDAVAGADIAIDAADSFAVSYILSDACQHLGIPLISASVLGQSGYVGGFCGPAPSLRAVFPDLPARAATCSTAGVLGPAVGTVGTLQAQMALQVLLGQEGSPLGRLVRMDLKTMQFGGFSFLGAPEPDFRPSFVSLEELSPTDRVLELRDASETPSLPTPWATRIALVNLCSFSPDADQRIVLSCATGLRAWQAASTLHANGHGDLALLAARACG